jgi:hypothetical protein
VFSNLQKTCDLSAENPVALDKILGMSHAFRQGDEIKYSSGMSRAQGSDEQFVILQYTRIT